MRMCPTGYPPFTLMRQHHGSIPEERVRYPRALASVASGIKLSISPCHVKRLSFRKTVYLWRLAFPMRNESALYAIHMHLSRLCQHTHPTLQQSHARIQTLRTLHRQESIRLTPIITMFNIQTLHLMDSSQALLEYCNMLLTMILRFETAIYRSQILQKRKQLLLQETTVPKPQSFIERHFSKSPYPMRYEDNASPLHDRRFSDWMTFDPLTTSIFMCACR